MNSIMITKQDLINLGFTNATAQKIIKEGKKELVNMGFNLYNNKRVGTIPISIAEKILGFELKKEN